MKSVIASTVLAALAVLPAWVSAILITNSNFEGIEAGKPFEITWSDATGPVTITLKDGPSENLKDVAVLISGATGESYTWTPSSSLPSGTYALQISDGSDVNYSKQFEIEGGSASSTSASSSSSSSSSSTASETTTSTVSSTTESTTTTTSASETTTSSSTSESTSATTSESSTTSSVSSTTLVSSTSSTTRASTTTSPTAVPNTNAAQTVAPFVAPMLLAVGAVLM